MCTPILENRITGCHGNNAFSHISPNRFTFKEHFFRIKGVPGNNLAPMKNCPWGCKVGLIRYRCKTNTGYALVSPSSVLYFVFSQHVFSINTCLFFFKCQFRGRDKPPCHSIFICSCLCIYFLPFAMKRRSYCI